MGDVRTLVLTLVVLILLSGTGRADDSRTPRAFYLGTTMGIGMRSEPSEFDPDLDTIGIVFAGGLNVGIQRISGGTAFAIDSDILPFGGVYRARGSLVFGHAFTTKYSTPCLGPAGYSCQKVYSGRNVRSVFGLKLGAEVGTAPDGETTALEIGFALRSQLSLDATLNFDPVRGVPGGAMDFAWQFGAFYFGMEVRGLASKDEPIPLLATLKLGYASAMW